MGTTNYIFRIDGAKDNDAFAAAVRPHASVFYAGIEFHVGAFGWTPDLLKVAIDEPPGCCSLTLIELEATESGARISCRKYLPESPAVVIEALNSYLDRVIRLCRSTADPREPSIRALRARLSAADRVKIYTAGALRSSIEFVEELPLIAQGESFPLPSGAAKTRENCHDLTLSGALRLSAEQAKRLSRCVLILDAVVRHCDHSTATLHAWRGQVRSQPLKRALSSNGTAYLSLRAFIFETRNRGVTLDSDSLTSELATLWSIGRSSRIDPERIRGLIEAYYPTGCAVPQHTIMNEVFAAAREFVAQAGITPAARNDAATTLTGIAQTTESPDAGISH